jgi:hypothetical protein
VVTTLDSNKFAEKKQQRLHIGDRKTFRPYIRLHNQSSPVVSPHLTYDKMDNNFNDQQSIHPHIRLHNQSSPVISPSLFYYVKYESGILTYLSFPPDTKALLYYYTSPEKPRIAGELRFRVTSSDDPASFESGSDLMKPNGQVWSRPLFVLSKFFIPLYEKLREEQLVPDDLDAVLSTFPHRIAQYRRSQYLYTLNDTFIVDFSSYKQNVTVITEQGMVTLRLNGLFSQAPSKLMPYTGESPSLDSPRLMILQMNL